MSLVQQQLNRHAARIKAALSAVEGLNYSDIKDWFLENGREEYVSTTM
jgi:hypothetical protein